VERRTLALVLIGAATFGVVTVLVILAQSLRPSERARAEAIKLEVNDLALGSYRVFSGRNSRLFVVRTAADQVFALVVPVRAGKVVMPDLHWWQPLYDCANFGLGGTDGILAANAVFMCHDPGTPEWWAPRWRWHVDGTSASEVPNAYIEDMHGVKVQRSGGSIYVWKWDYPGVV
jgi:hypothetical protein